MTLSAWIKTTSSAKQFIIQQNRNLSSYQNEYIFQVSSGNIDFWDYGVAELGFNESSNSTKNVSDGNWHHVVFVKSGTFGEIFIDGVSNGTKTALQDVSYGPYELVIGKDQRDSSSYFDGSIDEVAIFNRSLSTQEILSLYNSTMNLYQNNFTNLSYSLHSFTGYAVDSSGNINSTEERIINISLITDTTYPTFSDYWANNATSTGSGNASFHVTIINTNGTAWLSINNTNYTATNLSLNVYNVSVLLSSAGTYNYTWNSYGNGTSRNFNSSQVMVYLVNATVTHIPTENSPSGSGGGDYLVEQNTNTGKLIIRTFISPNKSLTALIKQDKGTGLKEIELKSKNWLSGEIFVVAYNETPDFCSIKYGEDYKLYKVLDFNNSLGEESIDSGRLKIGVSKDWIYNNNISEIKFVRCYPEYEEIKSSYDLETTEEGIYNVYIHGFSAYAILGTLDIDEESVEKSWNAPEANSLDLGKTFLWILTFAVILGLILLLLKHKISLKEKIHSKFFDFEFRFRVGKR